MELALPRPSTQRLAVPLVTLMLGVAGGAGAAAALNDDETIRLPAVNSPVVENATPSNGTSNADSPPIFKSRAGGPATSGASVPTESANGNSFGERP